MIDERAAEKHKAAGKKQAKHFKPAPPKDDSPDIHTHK
jgi:hypothetical protein